MPSVPSTVPGSKPKKLLEQTRDVLRLKHYSLRTERSYCDWIERFIRFNHLRHPKEMGVMEITRFLTHLARVGNVSAATQNQALSALLFLYQQVLKQSVGWIDQVERAKRPKRIPVDIRTVQELLGHKDVSTTMIYTHVLNKPGVGVKSPLD